MSESLKSLIPVLTLLLGAVLGYITNLAGSSITRRQVITNKLFEQYLNTKSKICSVLSKLANLRTISEIKTNEIDKIRNTVSCLYFQHYDLLPKAVLLELQCLFFCLSDKQNNLYSIDEQLNVNVISEKGALESFLTNISIIPNFKFIAYYQLKSNNPDIRRAASINFQARKVLKEINNYFNLDYFMKMHKGLSKS